MRNKVIGPTCSATRNPSPKPVSAAFMALVSQFVPGPLGWRSNQSVPASQSRADGGNPVTSAESSLQDVLVTEREHWRDGPPHELFAQLRAHCPVHWTE